MLIRAIVSGDGARWMEAALAAVVMDDRRMGEPGIDERLNGAVENDWIGAEPSWYDETGTSLRWNERSVLDVTPSKGKHHTSSLLGKQGSIVAVRSVVIAALLSGTPPWDRCCDNTNQQAPSTKASGLCEPRRTCVPSAAVMFFDSWSHGGGTNKLSRIDLDLFGPSCVHAFECCLGLREELRVLDRAEADGNTGSVTRAPWEWEFIPLVYSVSEENGDPLT
jgi:hypothetical protein